MDQGRTVFLGHFMRDAGKDGSSKHYEMGGPSVIFSMLKKKGTVNGHMAPHSQAYYTLLATIHVDQDKQSSGIFQCNFII